MSELEKVLKYLDNLKEKNSEEIEFSEENPAINTIKIVQEFILNNELNLNCDHNLEDICAYFDNNLNKIESQIVKERIISCDNCFNIYSSLKNCDFSTNVNTPQELLNKVIKSDKDLFPSVLKVIAKNKYTFSGIATAIIISILIFLPLNKNESSFEIANSPQIRKEESSKVINKNEENAFLDSEKNNIAQSEIPEKIVPERSLMDKENPKMKVFKEDSQLQKTKDNNINLNNNKKDMISSKPSFETNQEREIIYKDSSVSNNDSSKLNTNIPTPNDTNIQNKTQDLSNDIIAKSPSEIYKEENTKNEVTEEKSKVTSDVKNGNTESSKIYGSENDSKKSNLSDEDRTIAASEPRYRKPSLNNDTKPIPLYTNQTINIRSIILDKPGFIIITNSDNKIIGQSDYYLSGEYKNIKLKIHEKTSNVKILIYFDSNSNKIFDKEDNAISATNLKLDI